MAGVLVVYVATGWLGLQHSSVGSQVTLIWPPSGIAVFALMRYGVKVWPAIWIGAFCVNFMVAPSVLPSVSIATGNVLGPACAVMLLKRSGFRASFDRPKDVLNFVLYGALISMLVPALWGSLSLFVAGSIGSSSFEQAFLTWWMGDALGVLVACPPLMTFFLKWEEEGHLLMMDWRRGTSFSSGSEMLCAWASLILFSLLVLSPLSLAYLPSYLALPFLVWLALRGNVLHASWASLFICCTVLWSVYAGTGSFVMPGGQVLAMRLWTFMASMVGINLLIAALRNENAASQRAAETSMALRESETRLKALLEALPDLVWQGVYLACNRRFEQFFGAAEAEIIGKTDYDFVSRELADFFRENDGLAISAGKPRINEEEVTFASDGHREFLETIKTPMYDAQGQLVGVLGIGRNISARNHAEMALRESEAKYRYLFERNPAPMLIYEREALMLVAVNDAFLRHYGYSQAQALAMRLTDLYPVEEQEAIADLAYKLRGHAEVGEWHHYRQDGSLMTIVASSHDVVFDGRPARVAVITDISERKRAELALKESELRYRRTFENMQDAVYVADLSGTVIDISPSIEKNSGYRREEIIGRPILDFYDDPADRSRFLAVLMQSGEVNDFTICLKGKTGRIHYVSVSAHFMKNEQGVPVGIEGLLRDITERKEMEDALRASEQQFRESLEFLPIAIGLVDVQGEVLFLNKEYVRLFGYTREDILTLNDRLSRTYPDPEYRNAVLAQWNEDISRPSDSGAVIPVRTQRIVCKDGRQITVEIMTRPVNALFITAFTDVTERLMHIREIERISRLYATLSEINSCIVRVRSREELFQEACSIPVSLGGFALSWIGLLDPDTRQIHVAAHSEDPQGFLAGIVVFADDRPEGRGPAGRAIREERTAVCNDFASDDRMQPLMWRAEAAGMHASIAVPIRSNGECIGAYMIYAAEANVFHEQEIRLVEEIAENISFGLDYLENERLRRCAEDALRESREQIRTILNSTADGIYGVDRDGVCMFCNAAALKMLGYEHEDQLKGKKIHDLVKHTKGSGEPYPWHECILHRVIVSGEQIHSERELLFRRDGSSFLAEIWGYPLRQGNTIAGAVVTFIDTTERNALENQLRQAQKMEAVGILAGGVAHDFNNIMSAITGSAYLMELTMAADDQNHAHLDQIVQSANRASALTQSLLAFSRKQVVNLQQIDLNEIVAPFGKFLLRLLREDIEMSIKQSEQKLPVVVDKGQIEQILMNLVTNARDAMPKGGRIFIRTSFQEIDQHFMVTHGYGEPGLYAMLTVSDTGAGIPEDIQRHIFDPFFTTKEQGKGSGLGLSMVYGIVKKHKGYINVYSEIGRGTTFRIYLPMAEERPVIQEQKTVSAKAIPGGSETILLAEDDDMLRIMTANILQRYGYQVIEATDGIDAVERFMEHSGMVRLMLLDGIMPKMNGMEAWDKVRTLRPDIRTIFMSGYPEEVFAKDGILKEGVEFLAKPVSPPDLLKKIREVLDR